MKRVSLASAGFALSCLLAACGGGGSTDATSGGATAAQDAGALTETAQAALTRQAQAQAQRRPEQFTARVREVDETVVWQQTETTVAGAAQQRSYTDHVTTVNADNSFGFERLVGGNLFERYQSNADGNRLSRDIVTNGNHCTYAPNRNFVEFPLYVGKVWTSQWQYNCALGYQETATQLSAVTGRETITIAAGTFDALRIGYVTLFTKSNDGNLQNGTTGQAVYLQESTCWWATSASRILKCSYKNTYFGATPPASYLKDYTFEASFVGKQYFPATRQVGSNSLWTETDTLVGGAVNSRLYTQTVTAVNADRSYLVDRTEANGSLGERYLHDVGGNRLTRFIAATSNNCAYTPKRDYLNFPLYVGKTWASSWHYGCAAGYREDAAHTAEVEALEEVTTAGGTFNALRVHFKTEFSNSNDFQLLNGSAGLATYRNDGICWWDVASKRIVKCDVAVGYDGPAPGSYRTRYATELAALPTP